MRFFAGLGMIGVGLIMIGRDKESMGTLGALWIVIGLLIIAQWVKYGRHKR